MNKTREYRRSAVELCRNCSGRGYTYEPDHGGVRMTEISVVPCPVCDGRGRVWKVNEGTVRVEPFEGQTE